jgi:poly-gamma-glutamate capsule biosynthesis protein CapA/YwtB (metallophosphatase superfamily)
MLGRGVAEAIAGGEGRRLVADEVVEVIAAADLFVLNLECCISARGERWPDPHKPFFFRAPPGAAELLAELGVHCVTLANNHALDFGAQALLDTLEHLGRVGVACVGAGADVREARRPAVLEHDGFRLALVAVSDHPAAFAAGEGRPGIAFTDLTGGGRLPDWLSAAIAGAGEAAVLVAPHWGPNMVAEPVPHVRAAAAALVRAGATLVAGHSAHVFHGVEGPVLYDLGDFLDDYRVDPQRRNDLGLLFLVSLTAAGPVRLEAVPLKLEYCHTRLAEGEDAAWIRRRFRDACRALGTDVSEDAGRLVVTWPLRT